MMQAEALSIPGAMLLRPRIFSDERGFFVEAWNRRAFREIGLDVEFLQDNHSHSKKGVLRGMHYQAGLRAQGKLVWVSRGEIFDVIVDLREDSPTFGKWDGRRLTSSAHERLWAPPGCAHGFLVLSESADCHYKCTGYYSPADERALRWDDPDVCIAWPLEPGESPLLSPKDAAAPSFAQCEKFRAHESVPEGSA